MATRPGEKHGTTESIEMYLETILTLQEEKDGVHAVDIARALGFSKPTVSEYLRRLTAAGYVTVDDNSHVTLTKKGDEIARGIYDRHVVLTALLTRLGVSAETAEDDACRVEHYISDETFTCLKAYYKNCLEK